uniref:Uncharacterized protein n=1 Tax=Glossina austeni TaxID=7395 RepID=A0A1A9UWC1_GLOAU
MLIVSSTSCSRSHYRHVTLSLVDRPSSDMLDLHRNSCGYLTQSAFDVVAAAVPVANRGLTPPPPPPPPAPPPAPLPPLPLYPKSATRPMRSDEQIATDEYQIDDRDDPQRMRDFDTSSAGQVTIEMEFLLQLQGLIAVIDML